MTANELIDIICPEHSRTSCSDNDVSNGFYSGHYQGQPRCSRCALLEIAAGEKMPPGFAGEIYFDWHKTKAGEK